MSLHTFHLANMPLLMAAGGLLRSPKAPGLRHIEVLAGMQLGSPVFSLRRMQLRRVAVFAEWDDEAALLDFLAQHPFGQKLNDGWHVRLKFLRRWGEVRELGGLPEVAERSKPDEPVVAVTLARIRLPELPRFIRWGRPVERQIQDHPEATLATAAIRLPRTVSTFSIWTSTRAMTGMVFGRDEDEAARRHVAAMAERDRRDFHREFTALRFRPLSEHGSWEGRADYVPLAQPGAHVTLTGQLVCSNVKQAASVAEQLPRHVQLTRAEPGCVSFVVRATADPLIWHVSERFVDRAAFEAHQARVSESDWGRATAGIKRDYVISDDDIGIAQ